METALHRSPLRAVWEGLEGAAVLAGSLCTWPLTKRWLRDWGSKEEERQRAWPGDRLASPESTRCTRAIEIAAPPADVWPWIVQFGLGRAGFYSYELLERLVGIPVTNVESIVPELQSIDVGDEVKLHPKAPGIPVALVDEGRAVCFGRPPQSTSPDEHPGRSWSIYVEPVGDRTTRLVVRGCFEPSDSLAKRMAAAVEVPIDFVMEQRLLRTVKRLAER